MQVTGDIAGRQYFVQALEKAAPCQMQMCLRIDSVRL
jgi:hypothetical protein